ncbi:MAG: thermonuclease family protein [Solirubrobacteraceae bacterium]|nr:thermonuclease family protein [Solirubrobacteraceae bacterium]
MSRVIDGDTLRVRRGNGETVAVRLALIDAPELSRTRYGRAECGGREAAAFLRQHAKGTVTLRRPGGKDTDRYGRQVREVVRRGRSIDEMVVTAGWAKPYRVADRSGGAAANRRIERAAARAKRDRRGVWARCGGFARPIG